MKILSFNISHYNKLNNMQSQMCKANCAKPSVHSQMCKAKYVKPIVQSQVCKAKCIKLKYINI